MRDEKITCDGCGADLTTRCNSVDYRLVLGSESKPGYGPGVYTDMMIYPPIDRTHHFCIMSCLDLWRDREKYASNLWQEWWTEWKADHGTKHEGGMTFYPEPPKDLRDTCDAEFKAAALVAFPIARPTRR